MTACEGLVGDAAGGMGFAGLGADDARGRDTAAFGDVDRVALAGLALRAASGGGGGGLGGLRLGDVEDVELALGGGLDDRLAGRVVGDVVAVEDVVVPVALAGLESLAREAGKRPSTRQP